MTASKSLFNMFLLLNRRKGLDLLQLSTNLITQDTRNSKNKQITFLSFMNTCEMLGNRTIPHEANTESLPQGYFCWLMEGC